MHDYDHRSDHSILITFYDKNKEVDFNNLHDNTNILNYIQNIQVLHFDLENEIIQISPQAFSDFIDFCQNIEITINLDYLISLTYLSIKYDATNLKNKIDEFILSQSIETVYNILRQKLQYPSLFSTIIEEKYISSHLPQYISSEKNCNDLVNLPLPILNRIIQLFLLKNVNYNQYRINFFNFLLKCLDVHGKDASVLLTNINFSEFEIERLITEYSDKINFDILDLNRLQNFAKEKLLINLFQVFFSLFIFSLMHFLVLPEHHYIIENYLYTSNITKPAYINEYNQKRKNSILLFNFLTNNGFNWSNKIDDYDNSRDLEEISYNKKIKYDATTFLYEKNLLNSSDFIDIIKRFNRFTIDIDYSNCNADKIFELVREIKINNLTEIVISLVFPDNEKRLLYFENAIEIKSSLSDLDSKSFHRFSHFSRIEIASIKNDGIKINQVLVKIFIPHGITSIENYLFKNFKMESISFPSSITSIGSGCFENCKSLVQVNLSSSLKGIQSSTFSGCISLKKVIIPQSITFIRSYAFSNCTSLLQISIQKNQATIEEYSSPQILIPSSVRSIGKSCFYNCSSIKAVIIESKIKQIEDYTFYKCSSLERIIIPSFVDEIGEYAFAGCIGLSCIEIDIHRTVTQPNSFSECYSLNTLIISPTVNVIKKNDFIHFRYLEEIKIPQSVTKLEDYAFYGCTFLKRIAIPSSITCISNYCFYECSFLNFISIAESVTSIGKYAFSECSSLTSVSIPPKAESIGRCSFYGCSNLQIISLPFYYSFNSIFGRKKPTSIKIEIHPEGSKSTSKFFKALTNSLNIL